jgi:hypothetical protein
MVIMKWRNVILSVASIGVAFGILYYFLGYKPAAVEPVPTQSVQYIQPTTTAMPEATQTAEAATPEENAVYNGIACMSMTGRPANALYYILSTDPNIGGMRGIDFVSAYEKNGFSYAGWVRYTDAERFAENAMRTGKVGGIYNNGGADLFRKLWHILLDDPAKQLKQDKTLDQICGNSP